MSLISGANRIAIRSSSVTRQAAQCLLRNEQRRAVSISSAIHKGLHRDSSGRDRRHPNARSRDERARTRDRHLSRRADSEVTEHTSNANRQNAFRASRFGSNAPRLPASRVSCNDDGRPISRSHQFAEAAESRDRPRLYERQTTQFKDRDEDSEETPQPRARPLTTASHAPSIEYAHPASQFLYGFNAVYAALRANRRKCHKLYVHDSTASKHEDHRANMHIDGLKKLAYQRGIQVIFGDRVDVRLLDRMSDGRAHNGVVLEASPLPIPSIASLSPPGRDQKGFRVELASPNTKSPTRECSSMNVQPLVLLIDDVLDPGNLGAILRSAYFLGVDAVILSGHVAPLNAVALKASSGAAEALPLFRAEKPDQMLKLSKISRWNVLAVNTPEVEGDTRRKSGRSPHFQSLTDQAGSVRYHIPRSGILTLDKKDLDRFLALQPLIVVLAGEGRGMRPYIKREANAFVEIVSPREKAISKVGLDSLNVSVAAGVAVQDVMSRMRATFVSRNRIADNAGLPSDTMFSLDNGTKASGIEDSDATILAETVSLGTKMQAQEPSTDAEQAHDAEQTVAEEVKVAAASA